MDDHSLRIVSERGPVVVPPAHPAAVDNIDDFLEFCIEIDRPLVADLFCGAGGLSLGLDAAGFQCVVGVDFEPNSIATYHTLFPGLALVRDLSDDDVIVGISDLLVRAGIDVIAGGPPCQPFSRAGRASINRLVERGIRDPHDHRRDLWQSFLEIVSRVHPRAMIMENVPDMALDDEGLILRLIVEDLEEQGYSVATRLVDAWRYGVPQHRKRLIVVALADGVGFIWPDEDPSVVTVNAAIDDLPPIDGGWSESGGPDGHEIYEVPRTPFQIRAREGMTGVMKHRVQDHVTRAVRDDDRQIFGQMDAATRYSDIDPGLKRYRDDIFDDKYKRLDGNGLSRTIIAHLAKDGYGFIHPRQDRTISIREAARLQTFPDRVRFAGPPTSALRQIGNAVPPLLGERIGQAVLLSLEEGTRNSLSTLEISERLAFWYAERENLASPWLRGKTTWAVRAGDAVLAASDSTALINTIWPIVEAILTASDVVENADLLETLASTPSRRTAVSELVGDASGESGMSEKRNQTSRRLAELAVADTDRDVLFSSRGVLRPVARYTGSNVDRVNQGSSGRVALARLVGVGEQARLANLALLEIAQTVCVPGRPRCSECPLVEECVFSESEKRNRQSQLDLADSEA